MPPVFEGEALGAELLHTFSWGVFKKVKSNSAALPAYLKTKNQKTTHLETWVPFCFFPWEILFVVIWRSLVPAWTQFLPNGCMPYMVWQKPACQQHPETSASPLTGRNHRWFMQDFPALPLTSQATVAWTCCPASWLTWSHCSRLCYGGLFNNNIGIFGKVLKV